MGESKSKASPKAKDKDSPKKEKETPPKDTTSSKVASKGRSWTRVIISMIIKLVILAILSFGAYIAYETYKPTPTSLDYGNAAQLQKEYTPKAYEYTVSFEEKSWEDHEKSARVWGGHLLSFTSEEEYYNVLKQLDTHMNNSKNRTIAQQFIVKASDAHKQNKKYGIWTGGRFIDESRWAPPIYSTTSHAKTSKYWSWSDGTKWGRGVSLWADKSPDGYGSCVLMEIKRRGDMKILKSEDCTRKLIAIYKRKK